MSHPYLRTAIVTLLAASVISACGKSDKPGAGAGMGPGGGRGMQPALVEIDTVRQQEWTNTLRALGTVKAHEAVTVTAKVSETVQAVHFESGQEVKQGAPLVTLSGLQQQAALASAQAQLKEAEQHYQRQEDRISHALSGQCQPDRGNRERPAFLF